MDPAVGALPAGLDVEAFDPAVRVQDDLYRHVNGRWIAEAAIPADRARSGAFLDLVDGAEAAVRALVEESQQADPGTEARKIGDLYASFMAEDAVEARGAEPLAEPLALVAATRSVAEVLDVLGSLERTGAGSLIQLFVDNDPGDPDRYLVFFEQGGLGLPDERYYRDDAFATHREAYRTFLGTMYSLAGLSDAETRADRVLALETEIAAQHWDAVRTRDVQATYNPMSWAGLGRRGGRARRAARGVGGGPRRARRRPRHRRRPAAELPHRRARRCSRPTASTRWRDWLAIRVIRPLAPVPLLRVRRCALRLHRHRPHRDARRSRPAGSAAWRSPRACSARPSAGSTWNGTSRRSPRCGWTCSSRTSSAPTAARSAPSTG